MNMRLIALITLILSFSFGVHAGGMSEIDYMTRDSVASYFFQNNLSFNEVWGLKIEKANDDDEIDFYVFSKASAELSNQDKFGEYECRTDFLRSGRSFDIVSTQCASE